MSTRGARKWSTEEWLAVVTVVGEGEAPKHVQRIRAGKHELLADELASLGGAEAGPAPFAYVLSGLGACTSITLRMYAERKGWNLGTVTVCLRLFREETGIRVEREVAIGGALVDAQRARLADICERTPVTLALKSGIGIKTTIR
ncbi:MAG TPA: OsmC family protein [Burkholderiales bacterium]|nr:OsmC family protein [Burkholderiales bacterium]